MRTFLLLLATFLPLAGQQPSLLNVWEQGVLVRQENGSNGRGLRLRREGPRGQVGVLEVPLALQTPSGQLRHLAYLDGQAYAWGRVFVAHSSPRPRRGESPIDAFRLMQKAERITSRQALYRSRDFRTWERIALEGLPDQDLAAVHPLRDGSFLGVSGTGLRGGSAAARFRVSPEGLLLQEGPSLPWSPPALSGSDGRRRFWTLFQSPDALLLQASGGAIAVDLKDASLLWRLAPKDRPAGTPWASLVSHQQMGPDSRLIQVARPRKGPSSTPPELGRGASLVMASHMESRAMSPATRLVAQALRTRLGQAGGVFQERAEVHTLDLRTGTWQLAPLLKRQIEVEQSWFNTLVESRPLHHDPLSDPWNYRLSCKGDGSLVLLPTRPFPGFWSQL